MSEDDMPPQKAPDSPHFYAWLQVVFSLSPGEGTVLRLNASLPAITDTLELRADLGQGLELELDGQGRYGCLQVSGHAGTVLAGITAVRCAPYGVHVLGNASNVSLTRVSAFGSVRDGIRLDPGSSFVTMADSVWSGNGGSGAYIRGTGHVVSRCKAGTNADGTEAQGNAENGVLAMACLNCLFADSLFSGNSIRNAFDAGIGIALLGSGSVVRRCKAGTDVSGTYAISNSHGMMIAGGALVEHSIMRLVGHAAEEKKKKHRKATFLI